MNEEEIWKDVIGFEGYYQVSNLGQIRNKYQKILNVVVAKDGYHQQNLSKKSVRKTIRVHRAIAQVFIPNPENKPCVHHIDHNKLNNRVDNLMWVTHDENLMLNYNNPTSKAGLITKEMMQTPEWRQMISDSLPKGKNHHKFEGYYLIGDRVFESSLAAEKALGIHHNIIQNRCKVTKPPGFDFIPVTKGA